MLPGLAREYSAMMIMTSLDAVDAQMRAIAVLLTAVAAVIVLLMLTSGLYFI